MTGILVLLPNSEDNMLTWPGCWCVMTMKAMPESGGMWPKNSCRASKPPAEEPMPTIGKRRIPGRPSSVSSGAGGSPSGENVKEGSSAFRAQFSALCCGRFAMGPAWNFAYVPSASRPCRTLPTEDAKRRSAPASAEKVIPCGRQRRPRASVARRGNMRIICRKVRCQYGAAARYGFPLTDSVTPVSSATGIVSTA